MCIGCSRGFTLNLHKSVSSKYDYENFDKNLNRINEKIKEYREIKKREFKRPSVIQIDLPVVNAPQIPPAPKISNKLGGT